MKTIEKDGNDIVLNGWISELGEAHDWLDQHDQSQNLACNGIRRVIAQIGAYRRTMKEFLAELKSAGGGE